MIEGMEILKDEVKHAVNKRKRIKKGNEKGWGGQHCDREGNRFCYLPISCNRISI